ncbi:MAG: hypothetical protein QNJ38_00785 [Prochloraceae cyanobacterium]|nr:hypothetical protein [Prochloraceae cyanobacterium]
MLLGFDRWKYLLLFLLVLGITTAIDLSRPDLFKVTAAEFLELRSTYRSIPLGSLFSRQNEQSDRTSIYSFPEQQAHSLPLSLLGWQDLENSGDYFDRIQPTPLGYLVWSNFPVKIYCDRPENKDRQFNASQKRSQQWLKAVEKAIAEWNEVIPLEVVLEPEIADIMVDRISPAIKGKINSETGLFDLPPVRSATTSYKFYLSQDKPPILSHRMTVQISPTLGYDAILGAARHELGHALGIWGHSEAETDIMYRSQTRNLASISPRDINTLKKVYQQPTQLGWRVSK